VGGGYVEIRRCLEYMDRTFWDEMASLENRMEAMFRSFGLWTPGRNRIGMLPARPFAPAMDVVGKNGDIVIRLDLPGIDPAKDLTVTAEGGELTIHGERQETSEVKEEEYYRAETFKGTFERHIPLPEGAPPEKISAQYVDGVLEIFVPGAPKPTLETKPKKIPVKAGVPAKA
jgi:HSP20 family protein